MELSEEQARIIDQWHAQAPDSRDPDRLTAHLRDFVAKHPDLADHLGLEEDFIFTVVDAFVGKGRHGEAAGFLERIRREYPRTYENKFGYIDKLLIAYNLATGKKDEIPACLRSFEKYPDRFPERLFDVLDLLKLGNCMDILQDFVFRIYVPVSSSRRIIGGGDIVSTVAELCYAPFAKPDYTPEDIEQLSKKMYSLDADIDEEYCKPETIGKILGKAFASAVDWNFNKCNSRKKMIDRYHDIAYNFHGYLSLRKKMDWTAGDFYIRQVFNYLVEVLPPKHPGKQPLSFSKDLIEETATKLSNNFLGARCSDYFGILNGLHHFADYLVDNEFVSREAGHAIQRCCQEIHEDKFPDLSDQYFEAIVFERFPLEYP